MGRSGVGKTHLVEAVLGPLGARGYKVATVKHTHHQVHADKPGSDTRRHLGAGSLKSVLAGPGFCTVYEENEMPFEQVVGLVGSGMDLVLVEGYKSAPVRKVEVVRNTQPMLPDDQVWMRVTSDQASQVVDALLKLLSQER